ncbi:hypothetical protein LWS67_11745 [Bacillus atrophaeus]|uniref:hypothetical protein n=1 Tax=Bacillus atrophaeus TaxID=1452 RepID=UPI001EFAD2B4|nr:hypothetical protein [Bacillus atrophaeus]MCG8397237.1 hypothetical protein [Bacillus atrophaeus]
MIKEVFYLKYEGFNLKHFIWIAMFMAIFLAALMHVAKGIKRNNLTIKVNYISLWKWTVRFLKSIKLNALFHSTSPAYT